MKNFLFIGSSHLIALIDAAKRLGATGEVVDLSEESDFAWQKIAFKEYDFLLSDYQLRLIFILIGPSASRGLVCLNTEGNFGIDPAFLNLCIQAKVKLNNQITKVVSYINGNEPAIFSLAEHPVPFDCFVDKNDPGLPPQSITRQVIPKDILIRDMIGRNGDTVAYIKIPKYIFSTENIVHILPPPPMADEEYMKSSPDSFANAFQDYGIAPKELRLKIYKLYAENITQRLKDMGIQTLGAPEGSAPDEYLSTDFCKGATHGNYRYGHLLLKELGAI